ncbi:MAG: hypothetical protein KF773_13650 [Deltaproteobacteria bacterium]|nr:hypothetical protein [Deltaproteobacteria bacterium]
MGLSVFAVRGRLVDPYRGTLAPPEAEDRARRDCDLRAFDDVVAAFACVRGARLTRAGRRLSLRRGDDALFVAFASAAPRVALDDASFEGDALLAIELLHLLLPLYGPVEIRSGDFADVIDGHEPIEAVAGRYRTYWVDVALRRARELGVRARPAPVPAPAAPAPSRAGYAVFAVAVAAVIAAFLALWLRGDWSKASTGESCLRGDDCRSGQCQPFERDRPESPGVCTESCDDDGDCPRSMLCGTGGRCVDRGWHDRR